MLRIVIHVGKKKKKLKEIKTESSIMIDWDHIIKFW